MCRNRGKTRKSLKSHKTYSKSHKTVTTRKNVKNVTFPRLNLNVTGPNAKLEMQKILTSSQSHNLFSFPIPTRPSDHSHPTSDFVSVSHSLTPDFVQSSPPLPVSHSPSLPEDPDSLPLFPFPFPQQIHKSLPPRSGAFLVRRR
jgi:hypothetical protein